MPVFSRFFTNLMSGVRSINQKYAEPQIQVTGLVKASLLTLRVYLLVLIGLLLYKFVITVQG